MSRRTYYSNITVCSHLYSFVRGIRKYFLVNSGRFRDIIFTVMSLAGRNLETHNSEEEFIIFSSVIISIQMWLRGALRNSRNPFFAPLYAGELRLN